MKIGGKYNWKGQAERLVYLGENWSGDGFWHQFAKVESPDTVWCEVKGGDLPMIEETPDEGVASAVRALGSRRKPLSEIEIWNAAVDARRAEKKARKRGLINKGIPT